MSTLLIVESPTKAKTIKKFLGSAYQVESSFGHIRDLPARKMGIDVKDDFSPTYEIPADKKDKVNDLKRAAKGADEIYLATDEDREGEAISWHIAEVLKIDPLKAKRITFHEITKSAIEAALKHARHIDMKLVDAQQTRRLLDRLVGFELSPLLWQKIRRGLSAGRVQSVATRLIVDRERERQAFKVEKYFSVEADWQIDSFDFTGKLTAINDKPIDKLGLKTEAEAKKVEAAVINQPGKVVTVEEKLVSKKPPTPLTTSSLQQEAYNRLRMSAKQTMTLAQKLYETGRITYMRTDSLNLADEFLNKAQQTIKTQFGNEFAKGTVHYKTGQSGAQEAHEAIRPTDPDFTPERASSLEPGQRKLYELIWRRTIASQMPAAKIKRTGIDIDINNHTFRATGASVVFLGYMKVWRASDDKLLPPLSKDQIISPAKKIRVDEHQTEPPARYTDASLVKIMEEHGIGRPSTYAPTIATIESRGYALRDDNKRFYPSEVAYVVTDLLSENFPQIVDYEFTANLEKQLDQIAEGEVDWLKTLHDFYKPFHGAIVDKTKHLERENINKTREIGNDPVTGFPILAKTGRFGPYVEVIDPKKAEDDKTRVVKRASLKKDLIFDNVVLQECLDALILPRVVGKNTDGQEIIAADGRFGPYLKVGDFNASLPKDKDPRTVTLSEAIEIIASVKAFKEKRNTPLKILGDLKIFDGRYGPYVTDGKINATIGKKTDPLTLTLEEALDLIAKKAKRAPSKFRRRSA